MPDEHIHYIIVRRDLPFGVTLAQVAHAAANSSDGVPCTVVVLGVPSRDDLLDLIDYLDANTIDYDVAFELDSPWDGQLMAVGVVPGLRRRLSRHFEHLDTYREFAGVAQAEEHSPCKRECGVSTTSSSAKSCGALPQ